MIDLYEFSQQHPDVFTTTTTLSAHALAATNVRRFLRKAYPATMGFKVRVRSSHDGGRIDVSWTNWPVPWDETLSTVDLHAFLLPFQDRDARLLQRGNLTTEGPRFRQRFGSVADLSLCSTQASSSEIAAREALDLQRFAQSLSDENGTRPSAQPRSRL